MNRQSRFPVYDTGYLKNAGSFAMAVDGSTVSKTFQFAPLSGVWAVSRIGVLIVDPGTTTPTNFGALGTLTNGIKLEMKTQGITQVVQTLKDNVDLTMVFSHNKMTTQLLDTLSAPVGWLNKIDYFCGELIFENPIIIRAASGDYFKAIVQDDLTGLETFRMMYKAFREIL